MLARTASRDRLSGKLGRVPRLHRGLRVSRTMELRGVPLLGACLVLATSSLAQPPPDKQQQIETHCRQASEFLKNNLLACVPLARPGIQEEGLNFPVWYVRYAYFRARVNLLQTIEKMVTSRRITIMLRYKPCQRCGSGSCYAGNGHGSYVRSTRAPEVSLR